MRRCSPRYVHNEGVRVETFEAQSHGFGTRYGHRAKHGRLRRAGYPATTQDSLPAAGPALPDGIGYPQGCNRKFWKLHHVIPPRSPSLVAQGHPSCSVLRFVEIESVRDKLPGKLALPGLVRQRVNTLVGCCRGLFQMKVRLAFSRPGSLACAAGLYGGSHEGKQTLNNSVPLLAASRRLPRRLSDNATTQCLLLLTTPISSGRRSWNVVRSAWAASKLTRFRNGKVPGTILAI